MRCLLALLGAALLAASPLAQTCTTEWALPADGAWEVAGNWTNGTPGSGDVACITAAGTYTVTADRTDRALTGLVLGGESGTQTLTTTSRITASGDVTVRPNGRWTFQNRIPGGTDGLVFAEGSGTFLVEGEVVVVGGVSVLDTGGTLDVADGGTLRLTDGAGVGDEDGLIRVRGEVVADCSAGTCQIHAPLDVDRGTLRAVTGRLDVRQGGTLRDLTLDAAAGATVYLSDPADRQYLIQGTLAGDLAGDVYWSGAVLAAPPQGATLALTGTGLQLIGSSLLVSGGGSFTNTGLLVRPEAVSNFSGLEGVEVVNRGTVEIRTGLRMGDGSLLRNEPEGVIEFTSTGIIGGVGTGDGLVVSRGLIVVRPTASGVPSIGVPVDLADSEVRVETARFDLRQGGALRDVTVSVAEGAALWLGGAFDVSGTLAGVPAGDLLLVSGTTLRAAADVTFDVGGTGLVAWPGSGQSVVLTSAGGAFTNAGLFQTEGNGLWVRRAVLRNTGTVQNRATLRIEEGAVVRNEGTVELIQGGGATSGDDSGRFVNAALVVVRPEEGQTGARSNFRGTLRSQTGSEVRVLDGAALDLAPPGSASLPAGARLTGDGLVYLLSRELFLEGTISPGTDEAPFDTLTTGSWTRLSRVAGDPRLVIDVGPGGVSDLVAAFRGAGPSGSVHLAGALVIRVAEGYTPRPGDTFTVLRTTNTTDDIEGDFDVVLTEGGPTDIAFVAERNADNSEVIVRAVEAAGGPLSVSADAVLGGGPRTVFLSGPGAPAVTAARLACTRCLDGDAFGTIPADVTGAGTVREVRVDLTSPRAFGFYDLVLERAGLPDTSVALTVRPFLSYLSLNHGIDRGVGVRPAGIRYNWSAFSVSNVSNSAQPGFGIGAVNREAPGQVSFAVAASNPFFRGGPFYESDAAADPAAPALVFARIEPGRSVPLLYGQRIDPDDVLFPEQSRTGPDDDRIPFGEPLVFSGLLAHHLSFDRVRGFVLEALNENDPLADYLADVEAADPGVVEREVEQVVFRARTYTEGLDGQLGRLLDGLDAVVPVPDGLRAAAAGPFKTSLDGAAGRHLVAIYQAHEVDLETAPADVRQLLVDEFEALGGYGDDAARRRDSAIGAATCQIRNLASTASSGIGRAATAVSTTNAQAQALQAQAAQATADQTVSTAQQATQAIKARCKTLLDVTGDARGSDGTPRGGRLARAGGSCGPPPPPPPGGPNGGGGASCGPPSAPADPNDKTAFEPQFRCETGTVTVDGEEVPRCVRYFVPLERADEPIVYTVDFENLPLATAPAETVTITDELDASLDPSTLEVLATSSDSTFSYTVSGRTATFRFVGIDLPPNVDDPEGKGFVTFGVRPRAGLAPGTEIRNDASIVFDFNPPIETPAVVHELRETADLGTALAVPGSGTEGEPFAFAAIAVNAQGDPASDVVLTVTSGAPIASASPSVGTCAGTGTTTVTCDVGALAAGEDVVVDLALEDVASGTYAISSAVSSAAFDAFAADDTDFAEADVWAVSTEPEGDALREVTLAPPAPNPARGPVTLRWGLPAAGRAHLRVFDLLGREVAELVPEGDVAAGWQQTAWAPSLASGVYVVRLDAGDEVRTRRIVVLR